MSKLSLEIGRVVELWRYPIKAMAGEPLNETEVSWFGFANDRRWAFVRPHQTRNGFPWLTQREQPSLVLYKPRLIETGAAHPKKQDHPHTSTVQVRTPDGRCLDITDPVLAAELDAQPMKCNRGIFDTMPLSLLTTQSRASLSQQTQMDLNIRRFRPNLVIEAIFDNAEFKSAYPEDNWVGAVLRMGTTRIRLDTHDQRCVVVNVDPTTGQRNASILRTIAQTRASKLGVYASTVQPGRVAVGDAVILDQVDRAASASSVGASIPRGKAPPR